MLSERLDPDGWEHALQSPYAALPSGHVAFAVVVAGVVGSQVRGPRFVAALYPLLVAVIVIGTANHLWFDALAGVTAAAAGFSLAVMRRTSSTVPESRCLGTSRTEREHVSTDASRSPRDARPAARA